MLTGLFDDSDARPEVLADTQPELSESGNLVVKQFEPPDAAVAKGTDKGAIVLPLCAVSVLDTA